LVLLRSSMASAARDHVAAGTGDPVGAGRTGAPQGDRSRSSIGCWPPLAAAPTSGECACPVHLLSGQETEHPLQKPHRGMEMRCGATPPEREQTMWRVLSGRAEAELWRNDELRDEQGEARPQAPRVAVCAGKVGYTGRGGMPWFTARGAR
jgi:hypothetical protein